MRKVFPPNPKIGDERTQSGFLWRRKTLAIRDADGKITGFDRRWWERATWVQRWVEHGWSVSNPNTGVVCWLPCYRDYAWADEGDEIRMFPGVEYVDAKGESICCERSDAHDH